MSIQQFAANIVNEQCIVPMLKTNQQYIKQVEELLQKTIDITTKFYKEHHHDKHDEEDKDCCCEECEDDSLMNWLYDNHQEPFFYILSGGILKISEPKSKKCKCSKKDDDPLSFTVSSYMIDCFNDIEYFISNYVKENYKAE